MEVHEASQQKLAASSPTRSPRVSSIPEKEESPILMSIDRRGRQAPGAWTKKYVAAHTCRKLGWIRRPTGAAQRLRGDIPCCRISRSVHLVGRDAAVWTSRRI